jgi:hypothetical protein
LRALWPPRLEPSRVVKTRAKALFMVRVRGWSVSK